MVGTTRSSSIDPSEVLTPVPRAACRVPRASLPGAVRVLDAFLVVRLGQAAVDGIRRRGHQETLGRRGHREDPLYRGRQLLRRGFTPVRVIEFG